MMPPRATVCFYITGHGYGHALREVQILKALPPEIRLLVKTTVPASVFAEELPGRGVEVIADEYDCGCVQRDSLTILSRETLSRYSEIARRNRSRLAEEVAFLSRERVRCVVSDIPAFPLRAAREAGIPGIAVANFTWSDIYREYIETDEDSRMIRDMDDEYGTAALALITPLSLPTVADPFPRVERIPLIARGGTSVRPALIEALGRPVGTHLALLYLGAWGLDIDWAALRALKDWVFLTYDAPPVPTPNVVTLDRLTWPYAKVMASVDAVVSKPGYGTVTECIANAVPLVYVPRRDFAETRALIAGMEPWGGGVPITKGDFHAGAWGSALESAVAARPDPRAYATNGAEVAAARLLATIH